MRTRLDDATASSVSRDLTQLQVEGTAGGGAVKAVVTGKREIVSIEIQPEVVDPEDVEMLQDLVLAAVGDALQKARDYARETAEENIKLKDSLRELAALRGEAGPTDKTAFDVIGQMIQSGATRAEATAFSTMFDSTIPAAVKKGAAGPDGKRPDVGLQLNPEQIAELKGLPVEEVAHATSANFERLFGIPPLPR